MLSRISPGTGCSAYFAGSSFGSCGYMRLAKNREESWLSRPEEPNELLEVPLRDAARLRDATLVRPSRRYPTYVRIELNAHGANRPDYPTPGGRPDSHVRGWSAPMVSATARSKRRSEPGEIRLRRFPQSPRPRSPPAFPGRSGGSPPPSSWPVETPRRTFPGPGPPPPLHPSPPSKV